MDVKSWFRMNPVDRSWYEVLSFLSKRSSHDLYTLKKKDLEKFGNYVDGETYQTLHTLGYIHLTTHNSQIVTPSGLDQLRRLEDIKRKNLSLAISVMGIFLTLMGSFAKVMGWI